MTQRNFTALFAFLSLAVLLTACGGGSTSPPEQGGIIGGDPAGGSGGGSSTPTYSMGAGSGSSFQPGAMSITSPTLSAGGSTTLAVSIVDQLGVLYATSTDVSFNSPCIAQGLATITSPITTTTGIATTTYVAKGCTGSDVVTASATVAAKALSANGTINVAAAAVGSIEFVSATPTNISLRGSSAPNLPENSTVVFRVRDSSTGPRPGATVNFSLISSTGGVSIAPLVATSDANGLVQTVVSSGTVPTTVAVRAVVSGTAIATQSSPLTITTGIADADSISLSVECYNVEGLDVDGTEVPVTVRMADRFNNPVPDGTAANFRTEGGSIAGQCVTGTINASDDDPSNDIKGACSVTWVSQNPRVGGRSSLLVTATGEETFVDVNGDGYFSNGDTFTDQGEPFLDTDESRTYSPGEPFLDFGIPNGVRDGGDGLFNGALCTHASLCSTRQAIGVSASNLIILSGSAALTSLYSGSLSLSASSATSATFHIRDRNGNVMPGGTKVTATIVGTGLTLAEPTSLGVPCTNQEAGGVYSGTTAFTFSIASDATATGTGRITIEVKTPLGLSTLDSFDITVTP